MKADALPRFDLDALRAEDLSSRWRYLKLAEFCLANGHEAQALRYADEQARHIEALKLGFVRKRNVMKLRG